MPLIVSSSKKSFHYATCRRAHKCTDDFSSRKVRNPAWKLSITYRLTGLFSAPTRVLFIVAPTNILLNYLLVWGPFTPLRLGFIGAPIATAISLNLITLFYCLYGLWIAPRVAWHPITKECLQELGILFKLGVSGVAQVAAEVSNKRSERARSESQ
jgi:hypothetical protein